MHDPITKNRRSTRSFYQVKAARTGEADIYLYDVIGDSWDGTTAKMFAEDLRALGEAATLNIYINSPGGSVFDGTAIYNILRRHKAEKRVRIDGIAASVASVVAMAGDTIEIAANGMVMIHDPWARLAGDAAEMRKMAALLDKIRGTILQAYVARATSPEEQLSTWMTAETWFNASEAVAAGLADRTVEPVAAAALAQHDVSDYRHAPPRLAAAVSPAPPGRPHPAIAKMRAILNDRRRPPTSPRPR